MLINSSDYIEILNDIKERIKSAHYRAVLGANREQILLFWHIGRTIILNTKYGSKFLENLSRDVKAEFPKVKGFSIRNLEYMRKFAEFVDDFSKVQTLFA
jgi:predicted nuclease of restriction endonuclease-like (RecB) superfamily